jgi:Type I phosphodiesterase / nucleotide pyrophosphatase
MLPPGAVRPDYTGYCLSSVPNTILSIFGVSHQRPKLPADALGTVETAGVDNVILLVCDGFGYREWKNQAGGGFVKTISEKGNVRPITTVFPSTTAAALTAISTGLTTQEHGLPEWYVYMSEIGEIIVSLPFTRPGEYGHDTLSGVLNPKALLDERTIFQRLKTEGVKSTSFTNRPLAHTVYSTLSRAGSDLSSYMTASDLAVSLRRQVEKSRGPALFYAYWPSVDTVEHTYGPNTDEAEVEASLISHALQEGFLSKMSKDAAKKTLILVTADHGQVNVVPEKLLYMNRWTKLSKAFAKTPSGKRILTWGGARDVFMQIEEDRLDETIDYLESKFAGTASIIKTEDLIDQGMFGINKPSRRFRRRAGNLMILPHGTKTAWYRYRKGDYLKVKGHHGGLTKDEMTIPLAAARVSDLL